MATITHTPINLKELQITDTGATILWKNKNNAAYGIYSHSDEHGVYIIFASSPTPMCMGRETTNEFYKAEFI